MLLYEKDPEYWKPCRRRDKACFAGRLDRAYVFWLSLKQIGSAELPSWVDTHLATVTRCITNLIVSLNMNQKLRIIMYMISSQLFQKSSGGIVLTFKCMARSSAVISRLLHVLRAGYLTNTRSYP